MNIRRHLLAAAAGLAISASGAIEARAAKPKVPPGRDPGGIAVALIGSGIDYRAPELAARLARDGEGELIGWDLADNDRRPFAEANPDGPFARALLAENKDVRLVLVRVAAGRHDQVATALRFVAGTPARIVVIVADHGDRLPFAGLDAAARNLSRLLIVVASRRIEATAASAVPSSPRTSGLVVVSAEPSASPEVDVMVTRRELPFAKPVEEAVPVPEPHDFAALRIAALAARLAATDPALSGATMKARILAAAAPRSPGPPAIANPSGIDWRK